ncbi:hypothetical protein [Winogradskyella sp. SM1960]|uniref:hypothetical protein n=1 Tax=Winogradskyella sp. SM1960 TaxID=2865955 RepID=UPI001CD7442B|nr:hypothetical protein [Winogradskyella sp. SM1960]
MKQFLIKIVWFLVTGFLMLIVLDVTYTSLYKHSNYTRSKVSWLRTLDSNDSYDYAVFGSSRVYFNFNPLIVNAKTGVKGLNLGYPGANNFEIKLMIKSFLKKYKANRIFVQVDDQYNKYHADPVAIIPFIPFIREPDLYKDIGRVNSKASSLYYLPFYRFMKYDSKIGFRELMMGLIKNNKYDKRLGYPITTNKEMKERNTSYDFKIEDKPNRHIEEIIQICKKEKVQIYFYTAPIYKANGNLDVIKRQLANYKDFSDFSEDESLFSDPYHLNALGTKVFTEQFIHTYFNP